MNISSKKNKPLLVGLTGGIGSGKSTVAKVFQALKIPVFNSDVEAKNIVDTNKQVKRAIINFFGNVYFDGKLDRKQMAKLVFAYPEKLKKLNEIVHPAVKDTFDNWVKKNEKENILIKEAAILIESGAYKEMDKIIVVEASLPIRKKRTFKRDSISATEFMKRVNNQLSDDKRRNYADFIIDNDTKMVIPQVLEVLKKL